MSLEQTLRCMYVCLAKSFLAQRCKHLQNVIQKGEVSFEILLLSPHPDKA